MPKGDKNILKADPEDGTTPIAHLLLEAIAISRLSGTAKGVLLLLARKTYGWYSDGVRFKDSAFSLDDCKKALGINKSTAHKVFEELANNKVILRDFSKPGYGYTYQINTRVSEWNNSCINHQLLAELTMGGLVKRTTVGLAKRLTPSATNLATPKERLNKVLNKDDKDIDLDDHILHPEKYLNPNTNWRRKGKNAGVNRINSDDPDKYIKGKYGHMVQR